MRSLAITQSCFVCVSHGSPPPRPSRPLPPAPPGLPPGSQLQTRCCSPTPTASAMPPFSYIPPTPAASAGSIWGCLQSRGYVTPLCSTTGGPGLLHTLLHTCYVPCYIGYVTGYVCPCCCRCCWRWGWCWCRQNKERRGTRPSAAQVSGPGGYIPRVTYPVTYPCQKMALHTLLHTPCFGGVCVWGA